MTCEVCKGSKEIKTPFFNIACPACMAKESDKQQNPLDGLKGFKAIKISDLAKMLGEAQGQQPKEIPFAEVIGQILGSQNPFDTKQIIKEQAKKAHEAVEKKVQSKKNKVTIPMEVAMEIEHALGMCEGDDKDSIVSFILQAAYPQVEAYVKQNPMGSINVYRAVTEGYQLPEDKSPVQEFVELLDSTEPTNWPSASSIAHEILSRAGLNPEEFLK